MNSSDTSPTQPRNVTIDRNRREVIRFSSAEDRKKAIQAVLDLGEHHQITMYDDPNEWWVNTDLVRKLRALGLQFQWMTENV